MQKKHSREKVKVIILYEVELVFHIFSIKGEISVWPVDPWEVASQTCLAVGPLIA